MPLMAAAKLALMATSKLMENVLETIMKSMTVALLIILMDLVPNAVLGSSMLIHFATAISFKGASKPKAAHVLRVVPGLP